MEGRTNTDGASITFKGREFDADDLQLIEGIVAKYGGLSRQELANTVCELLGWRRANGHLMTWECKGLLDDLEAGGRLQLPALRKGRPRGSKTSVPVTERGAPQTPISGTVRDVAPVTLVLVSTDEQRLLWRELVGRYHYLGHAVPFGAHLRYLIEAARPVPAVVGCLQVSSPAWKMAQRDRWIGWSEAQRTQTLQSIVNNSRFLLLPWVVVRNLASTVLSLMARQVSADWLRVYRRTPVLLETLVDSERYRGTAYRAANWIALGHTSGRGRGDRTHARHGASRKQLFVYPLRPDAREVLRGER